jgi:hypothetical protein
MVTMAKRANLVRVEWNPLAITRALVKGLVDAMELENAIVRQVTRARAAPSAKTAIIARIKRVSLVLAAVKRVALVVLKAATRYCIFPIVSSSANGRVLGHSAPMAMRTRMGLVSTSTSVPPCHATKPINSAPTAPAHTLAARAMPTANVGVAV